jgi:hypothetical protein
MTRRIAVVVTFALAAMVAAPSSVAQTSGGGELGPDYVRATAADLGAGTFPGGGLPSAPPATEPVYTWERAATGARCVLFTGPIPPELLGSLTPLPGLAEVPFSPLQIGSLQGAPPGALRLEGSGPLPSDAVLVGSFVVDTATPTDGGPGVFLSPRCSSPSEPLPPHPPDAARIWQQTPLPRAHIESSPPGTRDWPGIVNLESRFWADPLPDARASVTLDGYVVDVAAHPLAYAWALSDGTTSIGTTARGPEAPLRATFRRRGDQSATLYVVWGGLAHITAPTLGFDFGLQYLGTVTLPVTAVHHVAEIRALLRSRTARG